MLITKKDIIPHIHTQKENTLKTHFLATINGSNIPYTGEITTDTITLWRIPFWIKSLYPVFILHFNQKDELVDIRSKMNNFGRLQKRFLYILYVIVLTIYFLNNPFKHFEIRDLLIPVLISIILLLLFLLQYSIYTFETKNLTKELFDILDIEQETTVVENEFSLKKLIARLVAYTFCACAIYFSIFGLMANEGILYAIVIIGICLTYILTDVKIMMDRNKKNK